MTRVQHAAVRQGVQTAADVTFSGERLDEALKRNAPMVIIDAVQGYISQRIGEWHHGTEQEFAEAQGERLEQSKGDLESILFTAQESSLLEYVTHKLMHSALGAGIAAIKHEDVAAGAIAAPLGEVIAERFGAYTRSKLQADLKEGKISAHDYVAKIEEAKRNAIEVAKVSTAVTALFTGHDVNTAVNAASNAVENNFIPVLVAAAVIGMQVATIVDIVENSVKFKEALDKGDVNAAIAAGVGVALNVVPGQKLIPAAIRNTVKGVVTKAATKILHSKYGKAAVKAGGELVDAAGEKVQTLSKKVTDTTFVKGAGKGLEDWGVTKGGKSAAQGVEKGVDLSPRVKQNYWDDVDQVAPKNLADRAVKQPSSKEVDRLIGKSDTYKRQFFEREGKPKADTSLAAALVESKGGQIPLAIERGVKYDHIKKVNEAQGGLRDHIKDVKSQLSRPNLQFHERNALQKELSKASRLLDHTEGYVPRLKK